MVRLNALPDPQLFQPGKDSTANIHATTLFDTRVTSDYYYPEHNSPLGIITHTGGPGNYSVNNRHFSLTDNYFFILNRDSRIAIDITAKKGTGIVYLFFDPATCKAVLTVTGSSLNKLMEEPFTERNSFQSFTERLYHEQEVGLNALLHKVKMPAEEGVAEETIFSIFEKLITLNKRNKQELDNINAVKASTREEIYFRLYKAKFFIEENYSSAIALKDIAQHAMFNTYHLLRLFKQAFALTPHEYLTEVRLKNAAHLLSNSSLPVTDICPAVGFESLSSFSHLFKKFYKDPPALYRKKHTS